MKNRLSTTRAGSLAPWELSIGAAILMVLTLAFTVAGCNDRNPIAVKREEEQKAAEAKRKAEGEAAKQKSYSPKALKVTSSDGKIVLEWEIDLKSFQNIGAHVCGNVQLDQDEPPSDQEKCVKMEDLQQNLAFEIVSCDRPKPKKDQKKSEKVKSTFAQEEVEVSKEEAVENCIGYLDVNSALVETCEANASVHQQVNPRPEATCRIALTESPTTLNYLVEIEKNSIDLKKSQLKLQPWTELYEGGKFSEGEVIQF